MKSKFGSSGNFLAMKDSTLSKGLGRRRFYVGLVKRLVDLVATMLLVVLTAPIWILILVVLSLSGRPPIFLQTRIGLDLKPFSIIKFRTMKTDGDFNSTGRFQNLLRDTHLDELPQLLNVIRGHMSLVGPRPLLPEYVKFMSGSELKRCKIRPGITGLVQVRGGNSLSWESRFALDLKYISESCLGLDLQILVRTLTQVINSTSAVGISVRLDEIRASGQPGNNG